MGQSQRNFVAFDLGAESGRAILGTLANGKLSLEEKHRFPNPTARLRNHLHWNLPAQWEELKTGLRIAAAGNLPIDGIGVDTWGVDYGLLAPGGSLLANPYCYRDARTDGIMERTFRRIGREKLYELTGLQFMQFNTLFPEDTHNSYLNAFMSGGWISGICYPTLVFTTVILGFRHLLVRVPWQRSYLAIFAAFLGTVGENFIIDTDHWRHFWLMLGAMWGMIAAAQPYKAANQPAPPGSATGC